jgi:TolB-like protein/tetratricopeptide (TPR) repeat protein
VTLESGQTLLHYRLVEKLGEGGMGVVWRATDTRLQRPVALKLLTAGRAAERGCRDRILAEARAAAALNHPRIATMYQVHDDAEPPFIVMELAEGSSLRAAVVRGPLELRKVVALGEKIAEALAAAHAQRIVHGDIKPENIVVCEHDEPKLLDFGVARPIVDDTVTRTLAGEAPSSGSGPKIVGTLAYMAPEQMRGAAADARSDLFSLGVLLYELVAGRRPFVARDVAELMQQVQHAPPPPLDGSLCAEFTRIVARLLQKSPDDRYQSAADVRADLRNIGRELDVGSAISAAAAGKRAVGVLPLRMTTPNPGDEYLGVALAESLIGELSADGSLLVRPMSAVMRFAQQTVDPLQAARELNVQAIVDGSVQKLGEQIRVQAQARDAADGSVIAAVKEDSSMANLFELQDRLAATIGGALGTGQGEHSTPVAPTDSPYAYELYLRAVERMSRPNRWDTTTAIEMLKEATRIDPRFGDAWANLATSCLYMGSVFDPKAEWYRQADEAIEKALALAPGHSNVQVARGRILWSPQKGFQNRPALEALAQALRTSPGSFQGLLWMSLIQLHVGLMDEARAGLAEVLAIEPDDPLSLNFLGQAIWYQGDYELARAYQDRALAVDPAHPWANLFHPTIALYCGELDVAEKQLERTRQVMGGDAMVVSCEALLWAKRGDAARAAPLIEAAKNDEASLLHTHHSQHNLAAAHAVLEERDEAVEQLRMAADEGLPNYPLFRDDPHLGPLKGHGGFDELMQRLDADWRAFKRDFGG